MFYIRQRSCKKGNVIIISEGITFFNEKSYFIIWQECEPMRTKFIAEAYILNGILFWKALETNFIIKNNTYNACLRNDSFWILENILLVCFLSCILVQIRLF